MICDLHSVFCVRRFSVRKDDGDSDSSSSYSEVTLDSHKIKAMQLRQRFNRLSLTRLMRNFHAIATEE